MIKQRDAFQMIKNELKEQYRPLRLFLYGSRANGTARIDSDYDFVMVLKDFDKKNRLNLMAQISNHFLETYNIKVQVWTYSEDDFNDWKDEFNSIPENALNTGQEIDLG